MQALFITVSFTAFYFFSGNVSAITFTQCSRVASEYSKQLPINIDAVTTLKAIACVPGKIKPTLLYLYELDTSDNPSVSATDLTMILKPNMTASWCSMPGQRVLLKEVDILYRYTKLSGRFIGDIKIRNEDC